MRQESRVLARTKNRVGTSIFSSISQTPPIRLRKTCLGEDSSPPHIRAGRDDIMEIVGDTDESNLNIRKLRMHWERLASFFCLSEAVLVGAFRFQLSVSVHWWYQPLCVGTAHPVGSAITRRPTFDNILTSYPWINRNWCLGWDSVPLAILFNSPDIEITTLGRPGDNATP